MRFNLPSFVLIARDLTSEEWARQTDRRRDYYAIEIRRKREKTGITLCVGSPVIMTEGSEWNETAAARSAISFANAPWCADDDTEREWMEAHGEDLSNEAFCHRTLGAEMRKECA